MPAAEADDVAAIALAGSVFRLRHKRVEGFALFGFLQACGFALVGFTVEGLGNGGGTAHLAQDEDFDDEGAALIADFEYVSDVDFTRGFGFNVLGANAAEIAGTRGEGAGLKEARGPEPFVDADAGHFS